MAAVRILILGAAGRDFHNFNVLYRDDPSAEVVAFTAEQIPNIAGRSYPAALAGARYPRGVPIHEESRLEELVRELRVDVCVFAYSDLSHVEVMHLASRANAAGADFHLIAPLRTMLRSRRPVIAVCASRTGAGKSQTTRAIVRALRDRKRRVAVLRHPMPYGDLEKQRVQRFADRDDLRRHDVTIEEREEYEPHIETGSVVFAGVDYAAILREAEEEADVIVWDGGNNDTSFLVADLYLTVVDPHRRGHELTHHPGETNLRLADVVLINKVDTAERKWVDEVRANVERTNPRAAVLTASSPPRADDEAVLRGRRVLAVEDGPTLTHGGMTFGAATVAAQRAGASLVDPRPYAVGDIAATLEKYRHIGELIPAMGYGESQVRDLEQSITRAVNEGGVEAVAIGTPIDLAQIVRIPVPATRVRYELEEVSPPGLDGFVQQALAKAEDTRAGG